MWIRRRARDGPWSPIRPEPTGTEPLLRDYFFERVRPIVEKALAENDRSHWPLIVLHFDFKDNQAPLLHAVWDVLGEYQGWITTAVKTRRPAPSGALRTEAAAGADGRFRRAGRGLLQRSSGGCEAAALRLGPHEGHSVGAESAARPSARDPAAGGAAAGPAHELPAMVEQLMVRGGRRRTARRPAIGRRPTTGACSALVDHAHKLGYWIRFYTLDGFRAGEDRGWGDGYNFGSRAAVGRDGRRQLRRAWI